MVKLLSAMQESGVPSLAWEEPLEKEMVTHSSILAWKIPWTEEAARLHFTSHLPISELLFQLWRCGSAGCGPLFLRIGQGEA